MLLIYFLSSIAWGNTQDQQLAEKFSPILILVEDPTDSNKKVIFPELVEIMKAKSASNLKFRIYNALEQTLIDEFYSNLTSSWQAHLNSIYQNSIHNSINLAQNKFAFLPAALKYTGKPPGFANGIYFVLAYFDYPGNREKGNNSWYDYYFGRTNPPHSQAGANFKNTAYVHIFQIENAQEPSIRTYNGKYVIRYYYYYPFNDWKNNHEGDWQSIDVIVTSRDTATAELFGVGYWFHSEGITYSQKGGRKFVPRTHFAPAEGGTHPVVYVGAGSHGGFPTGGNYPRKIPYVLTERMTTYGLVLSTSVANTKPKVAKSYDLILLPEPDTTQANMGLAPEMSWLGTGALWGTPNVESPLDIIPYFDNYSLSPQGPFHKDNWGKWKNGNYKHTDIPYTEFQQFPIVQNVTWRDTIDLIGDIVVYPGATLTIDAGTTIKASPKRDIHGLKDASRV
ncbi:MAG: hypothetical protein F4W91_10325, partial [Gemmatimonadetes bacterium]|nr:hypothetical protein [Gemmatimonadota bacterium]